MTFHYIFSSPKPHRPALQPTQPPTQWVPGFLVRDKGAGVLKLTTHLQLVLVKNEWNYTYMPYTCIDGMERDNLTFNFNSNDSLLIASKPQAKCRSHFFLHALQLTVPIMHNPKLQSIYAWVELFFSIILIANYHSDVIKSNYYTGTTVWFFIFLWYYSICAGMAWTAVL